MIEINWQPRMSPLRPAAVLGVGPVAAVLARALIDRIARGGDLRVHAGPGCVLAIGEEPDLPWVDGATWLGRDGPLYTPTTLVPVLPAELLARAIARRTSSSGAWIALLPDRLLVGDTSFGIPDPSRLAAIAFTAPRAAEASIAEPADAADPAAEP